MTFNDAASRPCAESHRDMVILESTPALGECMTTFLIKRAFCQPTEVKKELE